MLCCIPFVYNLNNLLSLQQFVFPILVLGLHFFYADIFSWLIKI